MRACGALWCVEGAADATPSEHGVTSEASFWILAAPVNHGNLASLPQTSAKSGYNVKALFKKIVGALAELEHDAGDGDAGAGGAHGQAVGTVITGSQLSSSAPKPKAATSCCA